ncbi:helix-turn-helix transcriptional regulator [Streptomyces sp. NPDC094448]|uniref:helix-turn-helix transcriptional regulator n=1 Tax=Streptomyces sp. NPDC094448 TaxID=3366063 RepID=UPI003807AFE7
MPIGQLVRDLRGARGWTQVQLADNLALSAGDPSGAPGRDAVKRWETGKVIPGDHWLHYLAKVFEVPFETLKAEATLDRVNRRSFIGLSALVTTHGQLASEMLVSIAGRDSGPLATVQTTHGTDVVIASMADKASVSHLARWMRDAETPVLRVNAAGILAKLPGQAQAAKVVQVLAHDDEVRHLYATAVTSRVCAVDWTTARRIVTNPAAYASRAQFLAARFAQESVNPSDAGARWCSSVMLRELSPLIGRS